MIYIFCIGDDRSIKINFFSKVYAEINQIVERQQAILDDFDKVVAISTEQLKQIRNNFFENKNKYLEQFSSELQELDQKSLEELLDTYEGLQDILAEEYNKAADKTKKDHYELALKEDNLRCAELAFDGNSLFIKSKTGNLNQKKHINSDEQNFVVVVHGAETNDSKMRVTKRENETQGTVLDIYPIHIAEFIKATFIDKQVSAIPCNFIELLVCSSQYAGFELAMLLPTVKKVVCSSIPTSYSAEHLLQSTAYGAAKVCYRRDGDDFYPKIIAGTDEELAKAYKDAQNNNGDSYTNQAKFNTFRHIIEQYPKPEVTKTLSL